MAEPAARYRDEDGVSLIEIKLATVHQLFDSFDPLSFHALDLDADAEARIVGAVRDFATVVTSVSYPEFAHCARQHTGEMTVQCAPGRRYAAQ